MALTVIVNSWLLLPFDHSQQLLLPLHAQLLQNTVED